MSRPPDAPVRMMLEPDAGDLLAASGIPYVDHGVAASADEAGAVAARIGYPVVLKVVSADIVHKTEVGGVMTGLLDDAAVRDGFAALMSTVHRRLPSARIVGALVCRHVKVSRELIIGATYDATFGPTVMVGLGGVDAEVLADVAFRLAPLHRDDGLDMLHELHGFQLLAGHRGEPAVDLEAVADVIVKVGDLILTRREIAEIDLNPVAVSANECVALDARIIMREDYGDART